MKNYSIKKSQVLFFMVLLPFLGRAQEDVPFKPKYFKGKRKEFESAFQAYTTGQKLMKEATRTQSLATLRTALPYLRAAVQFNPRHYDLNYLMGLAHLELSEYDSALLYLKRLPPDDQRVPAEAALLTAAALRRTERYKEALLQMEIFFRRQPSSQPFPLVSGRVLVPDEEAHYIRLAADMNTASIPYRKSSPFAGFEKIFSAIGLPLYTFDERAVLFAGLLKKEKTGALMDAGLWWRSSSHFEPLKSSDTVSSDFQFTWLSDDASCVVGFQTLADGNRELFGLRRGQNGWEPWDLPRRLSASPSQEICGAFNNNLSVFYFVSDRPGGLGGFDIYESRLLSSGEWSAPRNLGRTLNTEKNERWVSPHYDGHTLIFTSEGHNSIGGLDVFISRRSGDVWAAPVNPGALLNSPFDEAMAYVDLSMQKMYVLRENRENNQREALMFFRPHDFSKPVIDATVVLSESSPVAFRLSHVPEPGFHLFPAVMVLKLVRPSSQSWPSGSVILADTSGRLVRELVISGYPSDTFSCTWPSGRSVYVMMQATGCLPWLRHVPASLQPRYGDAVFQPAFVPLRPGAIYRFDGFTVRQAMENIAGASFPELDLLIPWLKKYPGLRLQFVARIPPWYERKKARLGVRRLTDYLKKKGIELMRFEVETEEDEALQTPVLDWRVLKV